jgi:tetratricopeptide (TPR) repeat protein
MSIAASVLSIWTQGLNVATDTNLQPVRTWPERLVTAGDAVWFYLGKLLWPHPLMTIYPRWEIDAGRWFSYLPLLAVMIVLVVLWLKRETWLRPWFFVFAYFLVALLPVLGLFNNAIFQYSLVFDHFQYLAGMGPLALAGAGLARLADFMIPGRSWLQSSLCAGLLLVLGMTSWQQAWAYESERILWTDTIEKNPKCWLAHYNLGWLVFQKGHLDEAMVEFRRALEIDPQDIPAYINLGSALFQEGRADEAIAQYQEAFTIDPKAFSAHNDLGVALFQKGRADEAMAQFQKALEIKPDYAEAYYNLGYALFQKGQVDEAIVEYQKALENNPNYAQAHYNLGNALLQKGRLDEAMDQYQKAVGNNPNYVEARYNLGSLLAQKGRLDEAMTQFQQVLKINPNLVAARNNLGVALMQQGRLGEAAAQFQEVLRLDPNNSTAQNNLARVRAMAP